MRRADDTARRAADLIERAGKVLASDACDTPLIASMAQLLAEVMADYAEVRRGQERSTRTIKDLHGTLREIRRYHGRGMEPQMLQRIDAVAPENMATLQRPVRLYAVRDPLDGTLYPMLSEQGAERFARSLDMIAEAEQREPSSSVVLSILPEVEHWRAVAEQEAAWSADAQHMAFAALQQVDTLNEQIEQLQAGLNVPTQPVRAVSVYADNCDGGRFVLLGTADGLGVYEGVQVVAYRDAKTGALHFRSPEEFEDCMTLEAKQR